MRVVEVEAVAEHRVGEGRAGAGQRPVEADDGGVGGARLLGDHGATLGRDAHGVRREAAADRVEEVELRGLHDLLGDLLVAEAEAPCGEALCGSCHL